VAANSWASAAFPAWVVGHDPARRIGCASYAKELTAKHVRDCRKGHGQTHTNER